MGQRGTFSDEQQRDHVFLGVASGIAAGVASGEALEATVAFPLLTSWRREEAFGKSKGCSLAKKTYDKFMYNLFVCVQFGYGL